MSTDEFAQKIKSKYPQYNSLSNQDLTSKMLAKYPQYKTQVQTDPLAGIEQGASGIMRGLGLGVIPDAISAVTNLPKEAGALFGDQQAKQQYAQSVASSPFTNPQIAQALQSGDRGQLAQGVASSAAGGVGGFNAAAQMVPEVGAAVNTLKGAGTLAKGVGYAATHPTMGTLGNEYSKFYNATKGITGDFGNIEKTAIQDATTGKNGADPAILKEVQSILEKRTPSPVNIGEQRPAGIQMPFGGRSNLTTEELHSLRKSFDPYAKWEKNVQGINYRSVQANRIIRDAVDKELQRVAPQIKKIDKFYKGYSKLGSPAKIAGKVALGAGINSPVGSWIPPQLKEVLDYLLFTR